MSLTPVLRRECTTLRKREWNPELSFALICRANSTFAATERATWRGNIPRKLRRMSNAKCTLSSAGNSRAVEVEKPSRTRNRRSRSDLRKRVARARRFRRLLAGRQPVEKAPPRRPRGKADHRHRAQKPDRLHRAAPVGQPRQAGPLLKQNARPRKPRNRRNEKAVLHSAPDERHQSRNVAIQGAPDVTTGANQTAT